MAFAQRHLKRLLAFSTIAHLGIMLSAIAAMTPDGLAGFLVYLFGHGLVKGTLFMIAGVLLALCASADEIILYNKGRRLWPAGIVMALAALLLGGLPFGLMHDASKIFEAATRPVAFAIVLATALTGAGVLRAALRIFFGWSGTPGVEFTAPTEREHEKDDRPLWLMLLPCIVLLAIALLPVMPAQGLLGTAAARLADPLSLATSSLPTPRGSLDAYAPIVLTIVLVAGSLLQRRATRATARLLFRLELLPFRGLQFLHSGLVGDYVAWMMIGLAARAMVIGR
jgi:multicomponent Na+:H+ antiporter subunit D